MTYTEKLPHFLKANALTQSLHERFYQNNPGFQQTIAKHGLPFRAHEEFAKADLAVCRTLGWISLRIAA